MIRLFVGLELPEDVKDSLYALRGGVPKAKWVERDNFHITLRFIGNIEERDASYIHGGLSQLQVPAFDLALTQIGFFANGPQLRHLWTGVSNYHALDFLHNKVDGVIRKQSLDDDRHKFHAHVTLAKLRGTTMEQVYKYISINNLFRSREFHVDYFTLFSSHKRTDGDGSYYKVEAQYPLFG